jgi:flagellar biosynthetic protein FlhB
VFFARAHELAPAPVLRFAMLTWLRGSAPFMLAALLASGVAVLVQTRFLLSFKTLRVDPSRISPRAGLRRLFGPDSLIEAGKSLAKITVLGFVLWRVMLTDLAGLLQAPSGDTAQLLARAAGPVLHVLLVVLAAQAGIAVLDYAWIALRHGRGLRMSRHDILEEQKVSNP